MDLLKFKYPDYNRFMVSGSPKLLEEAKSRGFYNGNTPYNKLFSTLFFRGGKIKSKGGNDELLNSEAWAYCRAFMRSFEPKHEEKEAVCAMIMSEILEPECETITETPTY